MTTIEQAHRYCNSIVLESDATKKLKTACIRSGRRVEVNIRKL